MPMEGLKRRLSFRKKKKDVKVPECSKPHQWQEDEKKVREGSCSFQVRVGVVSNLCCRCYLCHAEPGYTLLLQTV